MNHVAIAVIGWGLVIGVGEVVAGLPAVPSPSAVCQDGMCRAGQPEKQAVTQRRTPLPPAWPERGYVAGQPVRNVWRFLFPIRRQRAGQGLEVNAGEIPWLTN